MEARVLACMQITDAGALTAAELVARLRVSPAAISHAVAFLEQHGMLRRELIPGERRERYLVDDDIWLRNLVASVQMQNALSDMTRRGVEILGPGTPAGARFEQSAEFVAIVGAALRQAMEQWQVRLAERSAERE
ncbi:GbsR/MarR family transcriptional regulator [Nocardia fluminea]|uniref:GbsR/MarR family transcriptional regulator n=1 Tax=Nocardia fluminea TaxID=134984 RepID=UPI003F4D15E4